MIKITIILLISFTFISGNECVNSCLSNACGFTDFDCIDTLAGEMSCIKSECSITDYYCISQCCKSSYCKNVSSCLKNCATPDNWFEQVNSFIQKRNFSKNQQKDNQQKEYHNYRQVMHPIPITSKSPSQSDNLEACPKDGLFFSPCMLECYSSQCKHYSPRKKCYSQLQEEYNCLKKPNSGCCETNSCSHLLKCYTKCHIDKNFISEDLKYIETKNIKDISTKNKINQINNREDQGKQFHKEIIPPQKQESINHLFGLGTCVEKCFRNECNTVSSRDVCYFNLGKEILCGQKKQRECCTTDSCIPLLHCYILCSCNGQVQVFDQLKQSVDSQSKANINLSNIKIPHTENQINTTQQQGHTSQCVILLIHTFYFFLSFVIVF